MNTIRQVLLVFSAFLCVQIRLTAALPDLVPVALQVLEEITAAPNPKVQVVWSVANQGEGEVAGYWNDALYFSTVPILDSSSVPLAYASAPSSLQPGDRYWVTNQVTLPVIASGTYYLIIKANYYNSVPESTLTNNQLTASFTFESTPADLAPLALIAPATITGSPKPMVTVAWAVTNLGPGTAAGWWNDVLYISTNEVPSASDVLVYSRAENGPVPPGGVYWRTNSVRLPVVQSGNYVLSFKTDLENSLHEAMTNNILSGTKVAVNLLFPDLAPLGFFAPQVVTSAPNPTLTLVWGVTNQGVGLAASDNYRYDALYLSTNANLDATATLVTYFYEYSSLAASERYWRTNTLNLPVVDTGRYYLIFQTDGNGSVTESDDANNTVSVPVDFIIQRPDLVPRLQVASEITGPPYPNLTFAFGGTNQGLGEASGYWGDTVYLSSSPTGAPRDASFWFPHYQSVAPAGTYWETNTVRVPVVRDGTYYLILESDPNAYLFESDRSNNVISMPVTFHIVPPDLAPVALQLPTVVTGPPNAQITFVWGITNRGAGAAIGNVMWQDRIYLSTNSVGDTDARGLTSGYETGSVAPGEAYWRTNSLRVPIVQSGTYYFFLKTDADEGLIESDESNNLLGLPVTFVIQPPDLVPLGTPIPRTFTGPPNPFLTLTWGVTNQGAGLAQGGDSSWWDAVYFSSDPVLDPQDVDLSGSLNGGPLASGSSYWRTNTVRIPLTNSGDYYLIFKADSGDWVFEAAKSNNVVAVPVSFTLLPPDLVPIDLEVPSVVTGSPNPTVTLAWGVSNQGLGPAAMGYEAWFDAVYLSRNPTLDSSDIQILNSEEAGPIPAGGSYRGTRTIRLPVVTSTNYFLIFKTDSGNTVHEANETNNSIAVPVRFDIRLADLAATTFTVSNSVICPPYPALTFTWGVTNRGDGLAESLLYGYWNDQIFFSTNSVWDASATVLTTWTEGPSLAAGGSYARTSPLSVPVFTSGTYFFYFITDADRRLHDSDFGNNIISVPVNFTIQPADLAPIALVAPATVTSVPDPELTISWGVTNQGSGAALGGWIDTLYWSASPVLDETATLLRAWSEWGAIEPGADYWRTNTVSLALVQSGIYYLHFVTDEDNSIYESNLTNNSKVVPITFIITPPDLAPVALVAPRVVTGAPNPYVTIVWGVTNQGSGAAVGNWSWPDRLYLADRPTLDGTFTEITTISETGPTEPGSGYWRTNLIRIPVVESRDYYLILRANANDSLFESSLTNNLLAVPITFEIQPADLAPLAFHAPTQVTGGPNPSVRLLWGVTNQGSGTALGFESWVDLVHLSSDRVLDAGDVEIARNFETGPVTPGGNYWRTRTVTLPVNQSGNYYLIFSTDGQHVLLDGNYGNNASVMPITFILAPPDLRPIAFVAPTMVNDHAYPSVTFVWSVTNQGTTTANPSFGSVWTDAVFLTTDPLQPRWNQTQLSQASADPLPPGGSYWRTNTVRVPVSQTTNYFFVLRSDLEDAVSESNETNNTIVVPVTFNVALADLAPIAMLSPSVAVGPPNPVVTVVYGITNQGIGQAIPNDRWYDQVYFSATNVLDGTEVSVRWSAGPNALAPQGAYWRTNTVQLPVVNDGAYYLLLKANSEGRISESDYSNNVVAVPVSVHMISPDLAVFDVDAPSEIISSTGGEVSVTWGITNLGAVAVVGGWGWRNTVYISTVPVLDFSARRVVDAQVANTITLHPGGAYRLNNRVILPNLPSGDYYFLFEANSGNALRETNLSDNVVALPVTYTRVLPDLAPIFLQGPATFAGPPGQPFTLVWGVTNQGPGVALGESTYAWLRRKDTLFVSKNPVRDEDSYEVQEWEESDPILVGGCYWRTNIVTLGNLPSGSYYLILVVNEWNRLEESVSTNNVAILPITVDIMHPDLAVLGFQAPGHITGQPNPEITVVWGVTNQGPGIATAPIPTPGFNYPPLADAVYLSTVANLSDPWRQPAAVWTRTVPILPGASYWQTNRIRLPIGNSGSYYLIFKTDANEILFESDKANNTIAVPVTFNLSPPGDLAALSLIAPRVVAGTGYPTVPLVWQVGNEGAGSIESGRWDTVTLWSPTSGAVLAGRFWEDIRMPVGASYWRSNNVILPANESGDYFLTLSSDADGLLFDLDPANSYISVPITLDFSGPPAVLLSNPELVPNQGFRLLVYGSLGFYTLQASTDLQDWRRILDFFCSATPTTVLDPGAINMDRRFYRVVRITTLPSLHLELNRVGALADDTVELKIDGPAGIACRLEASTNLIDWMPMVHYPTLAPPVYIRDPSGSLPNHRFYRMVQE